MLPKLLIGAAFLLGAAPTAHAADGVRWGHAPDGHPLLGSTDAEARIQWWVCPPSEPCRAYPAPWNGVLGAFAPGDVARGSVFEGDGLGTKSAKIEGRSPVWMGRVTARIRPRVDGTLRVGQRVRPVGAVWSGGWADDGSTLALVACRRRCEYLTKADGSVTGTGPRTLERKHRGWSVYAVDHRTPADGPAPELKAGAAPRPVATALDAVSKRYGTVRSVA